MAKNPDTPKKSGKTPKSKAHRPEVQPIGPALADSWEFSADELTLTFKLDPEAKFHNGAAVTSAASAGRPL